jgi:hypothetical protein
MEKWITRVVAALVACGSLALFWTFGVFLAVPWRESRMRSLNSVEWQVLGIPLLVGLAVTWGALHILALADRETRPSCVAVFHDLRAADDHFRTGRSRRHGVDHRAHCLNRPPTPHHNWNP